MSGRKSKTKGAVGLLDSLKRKSLWRMASLLELYYGNQPHRTVDWLRGHVIASALQCICPYCKNVAPDLRVRRLNTAYEDDASNWLFSCHQCFRESFERYSEQWSEYYAMVM